MLWRLANAVRPNYPVNVDRIFGASYNTRSALEALLAHTPQFYYCYPGRTESYSISSIKQTKKGHKHLLWCPDEPHENGKISKKSTDIVISEVPNLNAFYKGLTLPDTVSTEELNKELREELNIDIKRRHAQIQIALYCIGRQLGYSTWIARNDQGIVYEGRQVRELEGIIDRLEEMQLMQGFPEAIKAALFIDCIWFKNGRMMPAVMEIEHSTGITSGLVRMKTFYDKAPRIKGMRYVIVAADEERQKVIREASREQFWDIETRFFPYSAVEELFAICQKRKLRGVTDEFLDCYIEQISN